MDAYDIFKKLTVGIKFDTDRWKDEAVRFGLVKKESQYGGKKRKKSNDKSFDSKKIKYNIEGAGHVLGDDEEEDSHTHAGEFETEATFHEASSQRESDSEEEISIKVLKSSKKSEKKKKEKSKEKLEEIRQEKVREFRNRHRINVRSDGSVPDPKASFEDMGLSTQLINNVQASGYDTPTPIQMQAVPVMMQNDELLACAPTGSGKTAAYLIPIVHQLKKPKNVGFRAVVLAPTRELAKQIFRECSRLSENTQLRVQMIGKATKAIEKFDPKGKQKFDILVTPPNRLVYLLNQDPPAIDLSHVEWLVVDESDKLFECGPRGFRDQMATINSACSSQSVRRAMFSATHHPSVEDWCKFNLKDFTLVTVGGRNRAVDSVDQKLIYVGNEWGKIIAFRDLIKDGLPVPVLIFVQSKERARELYKEVIYDGIMVGAIHSDMTQLQRDNTVKAFRTGKLWVLICTELMGRGIDFKGVNLVVNYDFPPSTISYIHRIGRTGRAGSRGKAVTFFTEQDKTYLSTIANIIKESGGEVPDYMLTLKKASQNDKKALQQRAPNRDFIVTDPKIRKKKMYKKKLRMEEAKEKAEARKKEKEKQKASQKNSSLPKSKKDKEKRKKEKKQDVEQQAKKQTRRKPVKLKTKTKK